MAAPINNSGSSSYVPFGGASGSTGGSSNSTQPLIGPMNYGYNSGSTYNGYSGDTWNDLQSIQTDIDSFQAQTNALLASGNGSMNNPSTTQSDSSGSSANYQAFTSTSSLGSPGDLSSNFIDPLMGSAISSWQAGMNISDDYSARHN